MSLCFLFACQQDDDDETIIVVDREVEVFSNIGFNRFDPAIGPQDFILDEDGSIVVVGTQNEFSVRQPTLVKINPQKELSWLEVLEVDQRAIYRDIDIIPTIDDRYMVLTYSDSATDPGFKINLTKVWPDGQVEWNKRIEEIDEEVRSSSIVQLSNGDYVVFGRIQEENPTISNKLILSRISAEGQIVWSEVMEHTGVLVARQLSYFPSDGSLIALSEHSESTLLLTKEVKVHKFDLDGNVIWQQSIMAPGLLSSESSHLVPIRNEQFMVLFSSDRTGTFDDFDVFLKKMDLDGNIEWEQNYRGNGSDIPRDIVQTNDDNFIMLSTTSSFGNGGLDIMLTKLDSNGEILWDKVYGSGASDQGNKLEQRENGNLLILGSTNHLNSSESIFDFFILETDADGISQ